MVSQTTFIFYHNPCDFAILNYKGIFAPFLGGNVMSIELKIAAAYIRVSTDNQTELSPDSQIKTIKQYAKQHGFIVPKEYIFRDDGISGRHADKRPEFVRMVATAKQKPAPFSAVLLWKFSRFARNQEESIFYKSMLRKNNIEVISVSEPVVDGPFGTLIERIIEWSDEYYSIRLSGEVKRGMTEKVERGGVVSVPAFGYDVVDNKYVVNPDTAPIVKKIFSDYLNGTGSYTIAQNLNAIGIKTTRGNQWENRNIDYILQNPVYIGKIRWNPKRRTKRNFDDPDIIIADGQHEPIIDNETFNEAQKIIAYNKKKHSSYTHSNVNQEYMLHGLVKCSNCGSSLTMAVKGKSLQCVKYIHGKCNISHSISIKLINEAVLSGIEQSFKSGIFNFTLKERTASAPQIDTSALIAKDELKLKRIKEAYEDGVYTLEEYKETRLLIEEHIHSLKQTASASKTDLSDKRKKIIAKNKNVVKQLRSPKTSEQEKNEILKSFVDHIVFNRQTGTVELFFYA